MTRTAVLQIVVATTLVLGCVPTYADDFIVFSQSGTPSSFERESFVRQTLAETPQLSTSLSLMEEAPSPSERPKAESRATIGIVTPTAPSPTHKARATLGAVPSRSLNLLESKQESSAVEYDKAPSPSSLTSTSEKSGGTSVNLGYLPENFVEDAPFEDSTTSNEVEINEFPALVDFQETETAQSSSPALSSNDQIEQSNDDASLLSKESSTTKPEEIQPSSTDRPKGAVVTSALPQYKINVNSAKLKEKEDDLLLEAPLPNSTSQSNSTDASKQPIDANAISSYEVLPEPKSEEIPSSPTNQRQIVVTSATPLFTDNSAQGLGENTIGIVHSPKGAAVTSATPQFAEGKESKSGEFAPGITDSQKGAIVTSATPQYKEDVNSDEIEDALNSLETPLPNPKAKTPLFTGSVVGIWQNGSPQYDHALNLRQIWLQSEKVVDTKTNPVDWGYRIESIFGTYQNQCLMDGGFDGKWGISGDGYAASIRQAYAQVGIGELSMKVGKFVSPVGFENPDISKNNFNTYSYGYLSEPGSHFGGLMKYQPNDSLAFQFGLATGHRCSYENRRGDTALIFDAFWQATDRFSIHYISEVEQVHSRLGEDRAMLCSQYYSVLNGVSVGDVKEYEHSLILQADLNDKWSYVISSDQSILSDRDLDLERFKMIEVANYLVYRPNEHWTYAGRVEFLRQVLTEAGTPEDSKGARPKQNCYGTTFCAAYHPTKYFALRPEIRYDWNQLKKVNDAGMTGSVAWLITF